MAEVQDGNGTPIAAAPRNKNRDVWFNALRDDYWFRLLVGKFDGEDEMVAVPYAELHSLLQNGKEEKKMTEGLLDHGQEDSSAVEVQSLRQLASKLPFAIRFKLELHLFDNTIIEIEQSKKPSDNPDDYKEEMAITARRMVIAFIEHVLPPLLKMDWESVTIDNVSGLDVDNFTMVELFAEAITSKLCTIKQKVKDGKSISFGQDDIERAMQRAELWLRRAMDHCGSEQDLGRGDSHDINIIKRRAMWPYAEYSCKFFPTGDLVPQEYEIINLHNAQSLHNQSRRGLREGGWLVRDRFCRITNSFEVCEGLVGWVRSKPVLCGRTYELLFDKGVGTDMKVWLFSKHEQGSSRREPELEVTRDQFLASLGNLREVPISKVGDRISLAFTQTVPITKLSEEQIIAIPELVQNGYAFSDGIGVMGYNVAREIQRAMNLPKLPGAAQIRIGGVKGMLSLNFDIQADTIGIRPSQMKFRSPHRILEVKHDDGSQCRLGGANNQNKLFKETLLVMDHLGVKCSTFYRLQEKACAKMAAEFDVQGALDGADEIQYLNHVLKNGTKANGEPFTRSELENIQLPMIEARNKVNLRISDLALMFGIIDEYDTLQENEVLVCNGKIQGDVLILRAPCMFPGDIQKARAIAGKPDKAFTYLDQVIVFSARGKRPLADMLGGGDLDGDKFFIIYDQEIVEAVFSSPPHDFGTQNPNIRSYADISRAFCAPDDHTYAPNIEDQLQVLSDFMTNGNLVSKSADAWLSFADVHGVAHENARLLAGLHQRALDSRKSYDSIEQSNLEYLHHVLENMSMPHYKRKGLGFKGSSLLGVLYELFGYFINSIEIHIKRSDTLQPSASLAMEAYQNEQLKIRTHNAMQNLDWQKKKKGKGCSYRYCITCGDFKDCDVMIKCAVCETSWVCPGNCEVQHWRICFGIQWRQSAVMLDDMDGMDDSTLSSSTFPEPSFLASWSITEDTASLTSFDSEVTFPMESRDTIEDLLGLVFGKKKKPTCAGLQIDWSRLKAVRDLPTLRQLTLVEFYAGFEKERHDARKKTKDQVDNPHIFDVFVMEPRLGRNNISMAVFMRNERAGGMLTWRDEHGDYWPRDPAFHLFRVASLSGTCRILESLYTTPIAGTLMDSALTRDPTTFVQPDDNIFQLKPELFLANLNISQKKAVATICGSAFTEGFFLCHGPPGTGKTITLAAMVESIGEALVVAPSNAAVANVAAKIFSRTQFDASNVVIFGENCDESVHFLSPMHRSRYFRTFQKDYWREQGKKDPQVLLAGFAQWLQIDKASLTERLNKQTVGEILILGFASWLRLPSGKVTLENIKEHCPRVDESDKGQRTLQKILANANVVLCTLNTAGSSFLRKTLDGKFNTLFLDEAAQCPEVEFYIATTFPGVRRIVLIGDPMQLNATVLDRDCELMGFGHSWMRHAMDHDSIQAHMLDIQYRSDPRILAFSNKHFYANSIRTAKSASNRQPTVCKPLQFVNTSPFGEEEQEGLSVKNYFEAVSVKILLKKDPDIKRVVSSLKEDKEPFRIMIITPYRAQVNLLTKELSKESMMENIRIDTVDAFQGQEADVVIFSLVRTRKAGFTDDPQRINVALTRAKRVVRIVGDLEFWSSGSSGDGSITKKLVEHCMEQGAVRDDPRLGSKNKKRMEAWLKPTWSLVNDALWKLNMTALFHHCIRKMSLTDKNVVLNTLIKLALGSLMDLASPPRPDKGKPSWQMSSLKSYEEKLLIIWCAKEGHLRPIIEAHFAGSKAECLHFQQTHLVLPKGAARVKRDLSGVEIADDSLEQFQNIELSWTLNRSIGDAILDTTITELPEGCFDLDPSQEQVLYQDLPVMLESGSGTGKTNVLFQHAVAYAYKVRGHDENGGICFVTVSPRLRRELHQRYKNFEKMTNEPLPPITFYSLRELLEDLIIFTKLDVELSEASSFIGYVNDMAKKSHVGIGVDTKEAENEVCGVILGSLEAAKAGKPLTRGEYVESVRSYIKTDTEAGEKKRHEIYNVYERYKKWKQDLNIFDLNDIVLSLINKLKDVKLYSKDSMKPNCGWVQLFNAVYLDEIQDFSYASIFLICKIAGTESLRWIFAGDTAQMISPGCSFTFSGLKEVLLAVKPNIEQKIKHVNKLEKNYRVTRDVLAVSNSILNIAKQYFRNDIQYLRPEKAMKDLGTRVRVCPWREALNLEKQPRFGPNQALIYSSTSNPDGVASEMNEWLNDHPFIMTSLDAKGLEFDDCVVAFDEEQSVWNISSDKVSSLRLLRELYVAVTRAKRRVVLLINSQKMRDFFMSLEDCNIEESDAKVALLEFDSATTRDEWLKRGRELFDDEQYKMAASCFKAAEDFGHFEWAQGKYEASQGLRDISKESFRRSAHFFFEKGDHKHSLDTLSLVMENPPWNSSDDHIYEECRLQLPSYFPPEKMIRFALSRNKWNEISIDDLKNESLAPIFRPLRMKTELKSIIATGSQSDLSDIEYSLPLAIGDYYFDRKDYLNATKLYLQQSDHSEQDPTMAEKATNLLIESMVSPTNSSIKTSSLNEITKCWRQSRASNLVSENSNANLLLQLYESPVTVAKSLRSIDALKKFGRDVIKSSFTISHEPKEELHRFSRDQFVSEVDRALNEKFKDNLIEAVQWYLHRDDRPHAEQLASKNIANWSNHDLMEIVRHKLNPKGLVQEADRKNCLTDLVRACLSSEVFNLKQAVEISNRALSSIEKAEANYESLIQVWEKHQHHVLVKKMLLKKPPSDTAVLLKLFWEPKSSSNQLSRRCMDSFGAKLVDIAVCSAVDDPKERYDILSNFDKEAFEHRRPSHTFKEGDNVILHGLQKFPNLNEKKGKIVRWLQEGRYAVKVDGRKNPMKILPSNLKIDDGYESESSDDESKFPNRRWGNGSFQTKTKTNFQPFNTSSSDDDDDDSDEPPALNARDQSSSDSSSDSSLPSLQERGNRSNSSESSGDDSSSSSIPELTKKDNSSSDEEDIPDLLNPDQQSSSSSDESAPRRRTRGMGAARSRRKR